MHTPWSGDKASFDELGARLHISVIIPAYNAERFLEETVNSVLAQTLDTWDLTIVDDRSTDDTLVLAERLAASECRIRVVALAVNVGAPGARNAGVAGLPSNSAPMESGLLFLDADDILEPSALTLLTAKLQTSPGLPGVYGNARFIDHKGNAIWCGGLERWTRRRPVLRDGRIRFDSGTPATGFESLVIWNGVTTPGMLLIRRSAWERVGWFDPACKPAEDWDMAIRLSRLGSLGFIDEVVLSYRRHDTNLSNQRKAMMLARLRVIAKARRDPANTPEQRAAVKKAFRPGARHSFTEKFNLARKAAKEHRWRSSVAELRRASVAAALFFRGCP